MPHTLPHAYMPQLVAHRTGMQLMYEGCVSITDAPHRTFLAWSKLSQTSQQATPAYLGTFAHTPTLDVHASAA